jgi:hypothetical protein
MKSSRPVARIGLRNDEFIQIFVETSEGKRLIKRPTCRLEGNITIILKEIG